MADIIIDWSVRFELLSVGFLCRLYISPWREQLLIFFFTLFSLNCLSITISEPIILPALFSFVIYAGTYCMKDTWESCCVIMFRCGNSTSPSSCSYFRISFLFLV